MTDIRSLKKFNDKSQIRHIIKTHNSIKYGVIDKEKEVVLSEGKEYSLNQFALTHLQKFNPDRKAVDAWLECEIKIDQYWINMGSIKEN